MLRYHLEVLYGPDQGLLCDLDSMDPLIVGSSSDAKMQLSDPEVKPAHVKITIEHGQVWLENVASTGMLVRNELVTGRTILMVGENFSIGATTVILRSNERHDEKKMPVALIAVIFLGCAVITAIVASHHDPVQFVNSELDDDSWHSIYKELDDWLIEMSNSRRIPADFAPMFRYAWFRDCSGDKKNALKLWQKVHQALNEIRVPTIPISEKTIAEQCSDDKENLVDLISKTSTWRVWKNNADMMDVNLLYSTVLWWFVNLRLQEIHKEID